MRKLLIVASFFSFLFNNVSAQPYVDLISAQGLTSGTNDITSENRFDSYVKWASFQVTLPKQFKDSSVFVVGLGYDRWNLKDDIWDLSFHTVYLPLTYFRPISAHSRIAIAFITRYNSETSITDQSGMQYGGAIVYTWRKNPSFALKGGLYYNKEFFGDYFLPLAGIDWKASDRLYIFGLLPNNLIIDYRLNKMLHTGFAYKGITTSFRFKKKFFPDYQSFEEGQLKIFVDFYILKNLVINIEAGQTVARKYGVGMLNEEPVILGVKDGTIFKAGLSYRLWVNK